MTREDRLFANLRPTPAEWVAVRLGVRRTRAIWKVCGGGERYRSPEGRPTADAAIRALGVPWTRQVALLNAVLVIAAEREGRSLGYQQRKYVA